MTEQPTAPRTAAGRTLLDNLVRLATTILGPEEYPPAATDQFLREVLAIEAEAAASVPAASEWCRGDCLIQHAHRYGPPAAPAAGLRDDLARRVGIPTIWIEQIEAAGYRIERSGATAGAASGQATPHQARESAPDTLAATPSPDPATNPTDVSSRLAGGAAPAAGLDWNHVGALISDALDYTNDGAVIAKAIRDYLAATPSPDPEPLDVERLTDILVDLEMDGLFGPGYVPRETAAAILARLSSGGEEPLTIEELQQDGAQE